MGSKQRKILMILVKEIVLGPVEVNQKGIEAIFSSLGVIYNAFARIVLNMIPKLCFEESSICLAQNQKRAESEQEKKRNWKVFFVILIYVRRYSWERLAELKKFFCYCTQTTFYLCIVLLIQKTPKKSRKELFATLVEERVCTDVLLYQHMFH